MRKNRLNRLAVGKHAQFSIYMLQLILTIFPIMLNYKLLQINLNSGQKFEAVKYTNVNLHDIVTPIHVDVYEQYLRCAGFDAEKTQFLVQGFKQGFDIRYWGPAERQDFSCNIPIRVESEMDMWEKLQKEVQLGRHAGPFMQIPYQFFVQSPIGLVPKSGNKTRLIFQLSFDFDDKDRKSINFYTPKEWCSVKYNDLDYTVKSCLNLIGKWSWKHNKDGKPAAIVSDVDGAAVNGDFSMHITEHVLDKIYMSKTDLMSTFRILPVLLRQRKYLIFKCHCPGMQITMYFVEKNLPFGSSISCAHFQLFSDSLRCLVQFATDRYLTCTNYLDDYIFISLEEKQCNGMVRCFLNLCLDIGCRVALEKTEWTSTNMVF